MTENFEASLDNVVRGYASTVTRLAKGYSESVRVRSTIKSTVEKRGNGKFIVRTRAGGPNARDARAREYGSGIHSRRGSKQKIVIVPRKAKALVFPWEKAADYIPRTPDGKVILRKVEHPGIQADNNGQGYILPAIRETNKLIRKRFGSEVGRAIVEDIRAGFSVRR